MVASGQQVPNLYFVTFDTGGDAMDAGDSEESAAGAFFINFLSGIW